MPKPDARSVKRPDAELRRKNVLLAVALMVFAVGLAASVFVWRAAHQAPLMPPTGGYGAGYGQ